MLDVISVELKQKQKEFFTLSMIDISNDKGLWQQWLEGL